MRPRIGSFMMKGKIRKRDKNIANLLAKKKKM